MANKTLTKLLLSGALAFTGVAATSLSDSPILTTQASAATPDDWNIATIGGIERSLNLDSGSASFPTNYTYAVGNLYKFDSFNWGAVPAGSITQRLYRILPDGSVQRLKTLELNNETIAHGGEYVYYKDYTIESGFPTGEYVQVSRHTNADGSITMERKQRINIVNDQMQAEGQIINNNRQVESDYTFFSNTKSSHTGRTGTYQVVSPSGKVLQSEKFTLGAELNGPYADQTKFKSQKFTTIDFAGYLNGTYKIQYTYYAGGAYYNDTINVVISAGRIASISEVN